MPQAIGIVTSLTWAPGSFRTNFENGYGMAPPYANPPALEAGGDYDSTGKRNKKLYRDMEQKFNRPQAQGGATVVVAVGGLMSAHPVVEKATQPFLVLIGRIPEAADFSLTDNENYKGGVELHMVHDNIKRRNALVAQFPASIPDPGKVYLLFNPNSRMSRSEANDWRAQGGDAIPAAMEGRNDADEFDTAFNRLQRRGATGVVISSDPFFLSQQIPLVRAANAAFTRFGIRICYPFDLFGAPTVPQPTSAISYGPNLNTAYNVMGQKARAIANDLDAGNAVTFKGLDTATLPANPTVY